MAIEYKHFRRSGLLLVKIRATGLAHLPMGLLEAWHMSNATGSRVYVFHHRRPLNAAFFDAEPEDVRIVPQGLRRRLVAEALWWCDDVPRIAIGWVSRVR